MNPLLENYIEKLKTVDDTDNSHKFVRDIDRLTQDLFKEIYKTRNLKKESDKDINHG